MVRCRVQIRRVLSLRVRPRAFTLVELLVVVAILSLLLALLTPALNRARQITRRAMCNSNMHQLAVAHRLYSVAWKEVLVREAIIVSAHPYPGDEVLPIRGNWLFWPEILRKYQSDKGLYDCPGVEERCTWHYVASWPGRRYYGIGINHIELSYSPWNPIDGPTSRHITLGMIQRPDRSFIFSDTGRVINSGEADPDKWVEMRGQQFIWSLTPNHGDHFNPNVAQRSLNRHLGKCSTVFMDSHVETIPVGQFGLQHYPGLAEDGGEAKGENILGRGNGKYDNRWLWGRG